jgi:hypothetical protein
MEQIRRALRSFRVFKKKRISIPRFGNRLAKRGMKTQSKKQADHRGGWMDFF